MLTQIQDTTVAAFHAGEQEMQARYGVREQLSELGKRVIRNHLIEQHRKFYEDLSFLFVGTVDEQNRPWASVLSGQPGFINSPDDKSLAINAGIIPGDPLQENLSAGVDIGLLGLMFNVRRRNRMNGTVRSVKDNGFEVEVVQSFGNCPKYIQQRDFFVPDSIEDNKTQIRVFKENHISVHEKKLIEKSDTLFIASQYSDEQAKANQGVDVSHRGGKPGFVGIEDDRTLLIPDFTGNNFFNTLGNLLLNPKAGLLFMDFDKGHLLYMTGETEIVFSGKELDSFQGAERLIRFTLDESILLEKALPYQWQLKEYSKFLKGTGSWNR